MNFHFIYSCNLNVSKVVVVKFDFPKWSHLNIDMTLDWSNTENVKFGFKYVQSYLKSTVHPKIATGSISSLNPILCRK